MYKQTISLVASAALVASLGADTLSLAPIAISANTLETDELHAAYATEIYTKSDIAKVHAQNIYEFLNQSTSITTIPSYGNPFSQKIDMHGYGADGYENIVILLNGRRLNNVDMIPQLLSSIPLNAIEKIEISKASGIVTAGDGANAGVINIVTDATDSSSFTLYGGTYHTYDGSFNVNKATDTLRFNLSGESYKNGGIRTIDSDGNKDDKSLTTASFSLAYIPNADIELRLGGDFSNIDTNYGGSMTLDEYKANPTQQGSSYGFPSTASYQKFSTRSITTGLTYDLNKALSLSIDGYHEIKKSNYITYSSTANYTYDTAKAHIDYQNSGFVLRAGIDGFAGERLHDSTTLDKKNIAAYATGGYTFGDETLQMGYRAERVNYDNHNNLDKNENLNGVEIGFNHRLSSTQSLFASFSNAYQSADIDRLFNYITGAFMGYVNPMKSNTYTLGYNIIQPKNKLKISAFYADLHDEIYYYSDPTYVASKNTNIDKSHKYGLDFSDHYILNDQWDVLLSYNYVQALIDTEHQNGEVYDGNKLPGVSNHNIKATLSYLPNTNTTLALTQIYRSSAYAQEDFNNNFSQKQDAYQSTNISITYAKDNYEIFAKINNLFDQSNGIWINNDEIYPIDFTTTFTAGLKFIF
jgi:iron complex outermembrane receptor protein